MLHIALRGCALGALLIGLGVATGSPALASDGAVEDIVQVLRQQGLIDEATQQQILAKNQVQRAPHVGDGFEFVKGVEWSGDLRLRNEQFWFDRAFGGDRRDRNRSRYRLRMKFSKQVNEFTKVGVRLTSGVDHNSTNVSFGDSSAFNDLDFGNDPIAIDQAFATFTLPEAGGGLRSSLTVGKFGNPFTWKNGKDFMVFDNDVTPEGAYLRGKLSPRENLDVFATLGYFIVDEKSSGADPKLVGLQVGGEGKLGDTKVGLRASWYQWRSLQRDFIARAEDAAVSGTSGNFAGAFDNGKARIGDLTAYAKLSAGDMPLLLFGTYVRNFSAESTGTVGDEDSAFGLGLEIGDKKRLKLGFAYFEVEANAFPSMFTDSDLFDGDTNREGWVAYLERELAKRLTLKLTYFNSEELEDGTAFAIGDATGADRRRLQSDIILKF